MNGIDPTDCFNQSFHLFRYHQLQIYSILLLFFCTENSKQVHCCSLFIARLPSNGVCVGGRKEQFSLFFLFKIIGDTLRHVTGEGILKSKLKKGARVLQHRLFVCVCVKCICYSLYKFLLTGNVNSVRPKVRLDVLLKLSRQFGLLRVAAATATG